MENTNIKNGIILIPDFNGFTQFVFNTKLFTGEYIVRQLLSILIDVNNQYFDISEIEGDAILFYKYDKKPCYKKISTLLVKMQNSFNAKIKELSKLMNTSIDLSLKFVVHYGQFSEYKIGNFQKLYGKTVIEAHQMLKNNLANQPSYIFYSTSFLTFLPYSDNTIDTAKHHICDFGMIEYFEGYGDSISD